MNTQDFYFTCQRADQDPNEACWSEDLHCDKGQTPQLALDKATLKAMYDAPAVQPLQKLDWLVKRDCQRENADNNEACWGEVMWRHKVANIIDIDSMWRPLFACEGHAGQIFGGKYKPEPK